MANKSNTIKIGGREIPLTKSGLPNMVHLQKEEKEVLIEFKAALKRERKELIIRELTDALNKLKK